jgi:hypothetical protein
MALSAGMCIGAYEILAPLGARGLGDVYREDGGIRGGSRI